MRNAVRNDAKMIAVWDDAVKEAKKLNRVQSGIVGL
jgi:hypothetical protein